LLGSAPGLLDPDLKGQVVKTQKLITQAQAAEQQFKDLMQHMRDEDRLNVCMQQSQEMILKILQSGATRVTLRGSYRHLTAAYDRSGSTLLHLAAKLGAATVVRDIVQNFRGSMLLVDAEGNTPLHVAKLAKQQSIAKLLVELGAPQNVKNAAGLTPYDTDDAVVEATDADFVSELVLQRFQELVVQLQTPTELPKAGFWSRCKYNIISGIIGAGVAVLTGFAVSMYTATNKVKVTVSTKSGTLDEHSNTSSSQHRTGTAAVIEDIDDSNSTAQQSTERSTEAETLQMAKVTARSPPRANVIAAVDSNASTVGSSSTNAGWQMVDSAAESSSGRRASAGDAMAPADTSMSGASSVMRRSSDSASLTQRRNASANNSSGVSLLQHWVMQ
jgi:Ankyrin repeats (3 copies)